ncbi:hypothetical protein PtB15_1B1000 [Puccinia triticina]|nr:hypothetical protein PtB15_1B1000 [Puccinia triticina]
MPNRRLPVPQRPERPAYGDHTKLMQWVENYFRSASNPADKGPSAIMTTTRFPLYFQHDGHSRTIIGIETDAKLQPQLLILDPAKKVAPALKKLSEQMSAAESAPAQPAATPASAGSVGPTRARKAPELDLHAHPKLLGAHRLSLKELSNKRQYQILYVLDHVPKPATADPDQPKFHTIRSLRIV